MLLQNEPRTEGYLLWCDMPPAGAGRAVERERSKRTYFYSGMVDGHGALFEDYRQDGWRVYSLLEFLAVRLAVGVVAGAAIDPDEDASRRQVGTLVAVFVAHLLFLVLWRPFIVPLATAAEAVIATAQLACVCLTYWRMPSNDCTVMGITLTPDEVDDKTSSLMMGCIVFMALRALAVSLPRWMVLPRRVKAAARAYVVRKATLREERAAAARRRGTQKNWRKLRNTVHVAGHLRPSRIVPVKEPAADDAIGDGGASAEAVEVFEDPATGDTTIRTTSTTTQTTTTTTTTTRQHGRNLAHRHKRQLSQRTQEHARQKRRQRRLKQQQQQLQSIGEVDGAGPGGSALAFLERQPTEQRRKGKRKAGQAARRRLPRGGWHTSTARLEAAMERAIAAKRNSIAGRAGGADAAAAGSPLSQAARRQVPRCSSMPTGVSRQLGAKSGDAATPANRHRRSVNMGDLAARRTTTMVTSLPSFASRAMVRGAASGGAGAAPRRGSQASTATVSTLRRGGGGDGDGDLRPRGTGTFAAVEAAAKWRRRAQQHASVAALRRRNGAARLESVGARSALQRAHLDPDMNKNRERWK